MIELTSETASQRNGRILSVGLLLSCSLLLLIGFFFNWQILRSDKDAEAQEARSAEYMISARRGDIRDRNGHLLAVEILNYHVCANPQAIKAEKRAEVAERLAPVIGSSRDTILKALLKTDQSYVRLALNIPAAQAKLITSWEIAGISLEKAPTRGHPEGSLAGQLLGFVNMDLKGYYGVEGQYSSVLSGEPGLQRIYDGAVGRAVEIRPPQDGADLILTVDRTMQYEAEKALRAVLQREQAERGMIIVMDPKTGAILAMAASPSYDPSRFGEASAKLYSNPAISEQYEPGSVMKIITMAAGLDSGVVTRDSVYRDDGYIRIGGRLIQNHDQQAYGYMNMTQLLSHSLNVGAATISLQLRADRFYSYLSNFGFGKKTGIDLTGEVAGMMNTPTTAGWTESDLGTNSFGQGIAVTPLQMITAIAAVANGGKLMQPYVVQEIRRGNEVIKTQPKVVRQVISEKTARELTQMLVDSINMSDQPITVPGYAVAGKTGSAQIPVGGIYDPDPSGVITSFIGYAPAEDPRFVVLVRVDRPQRELWGGTVAGPVFRDLAGRYFALLDIPPNSSVLAQQGAGAR